MNLASWKSVWAPANRTKLLVAVGLFLALSGVGFFWFILSDPSPSWVVRWRVTHYLKKHGSSSDFKVGFPFPSRAEMAQPRAVQAQPSAPPRGSRTGKEFDALAAEYLERKTEAVILDREVSESEAELGVRKPQLEEWSRQLAAAPAAGGDTNLATLRSNANVLRKRVAALEKKAAARPELQAQEKALEPINRDLWEIQRIWAETAQAAQAAQSTSLGTVVRGFLAEISKKVGGASSYGAIYHVIGQELWVGQRLFKSANREHRRAGLGIVLQARSHALNDAMNSWLAARICEGYLWPNLDVAETNDRRSPFFLENLLNECAQVFRDNGEVDNVARNYEILLDSAPTPQRADWARVQIAMAQEQAGNFRAALEHLREVKSTNDFRWAVNRIPQLEKRLERR